MSVIDDIKARVDIVELVGQYAELKRAGRNFLARCPFHNERTPSFHVDPARQTWHCFGACATGGDVFSFIMKKDGCDFPEAKRLLAERAGIELESRRDAHEDSRRSRLFDLNEAAANFYHAALTADSGPHAAGAAVARAYVAERRIIPESVATFQLGYAPNSWDALITHLASRGFSAADGVAAGLAIEGDRGTYDRFRHRLMFPIRDDRGRVAGFGGRLLPGDALGVGDAQPKYVNTSQSPIFDKGAIVYGLHLAKEAIRAEERAVIVEGYMDVIAAHEHGYTNVVASMGTALTERQVSLLKRSSRTLVLALDADNAGSEATIRSAYEIINNSLRRRPVPNARGIVRQVDAMDIDLRVLSMPDGRDPDDVIRAEAEQWPGLVASAQPVLDHLFDVATARHDLAQPRERSALANELTPFIALTADRVLQAHYLQRLARLARVDEDILRQGMRAPAGARPAASLNVNAAVPGSRDRREEFCLALLFQYPALRAEGVRLLQPELFGQAEHRALFECWVAWADEGAPFDESLAPDLRQPYERITSADLPAYDDDAMLKALRSTVWGIEQRRLRTEKRAGAAALAEIAADSSAIAERAQVVWESRTAEPHERSQDEADPAEAFVDDMEAGLHVHRRLLEQRDPGRVVGRGGE
jgi:DNA primase